ncbi:hypothetical protein DFJ73DRAFT_954340 [Zopfochytrium polystomum]|nr:hypothetical protein DFJ73DRAFT_954340 [Zopfochytrium polystomum]
MHLASLLASAALALLPSPATAAPFFFDAAAAPLTTTGSPCSTTFEGRIAQNATAGLFDSSASPFNNKFVLGQNLTWAEIIAFPDVEAGRFDKLANRKPISVSLSDKSVFRSGSEGVETKLRRAELLVNNKPSTVSGHVTWHVSVRSDPARPLNYSHEYILAFHEAQDFQADFWSLKTGNLLEAPRDENAGNVVPPLKELRLEGYKWDNPVKTFFRTPLVDGVWHNFGIDLDFPNNLISILYSTDCEPLTVVVPPTYNNISGAGKTTLGETHFGLQKRPTESNLNDFLFVGTQEDGIDEAFLFGGIFQDDSAADGCITL